MACPWSVIIACINGHHTWVFSPPYVGGQLEMYCDHCCRFQNGKGKHSLCTSLARPRAVASPLVCLNLAPSWKWPHSLIELSNTMQNTFGNSSMHTGEPSPPRPFCPTWPPLAWPRPVRLNLAQGPTKFFWGGGRGRTTMTTNTIG